MFRVHEVGPTRRVLEMVASIAGDRPPARTVRPWGFATDPYERAVVCAD
jgi:hypothetical protein